MFRTILATGLLACSLSANALPVTFDLAGGSSSSVDITDFDGGFFCNLIGCGISATLNPGLNSSSRTLSAGESWTFNFFTLNFYGVGGGTGSIEASLGFDAPADAPNADGSGQGGFVTFLGLISGGYLDWQPIDPFTLANGASYLVEFEDLEGIDTGSATVHATITLLREAVNVPEPGTLGMLGLGFLAAGALARRKQKA